VILKSYIVEENIKILGEYKAVLLYGENEGIKDDVKAKLKSLNKSSELIIFFENEIIKNKNVLYKNIINESLFSEKKIIFIQSATDKILNEISECLEQNNKNIKIYIFSETLEKKSKLRNLFEKNKELAVFPCYEDNERTLINYVSKEFNGYTGLTGELINLLIANSGLNRKIILSEIVKIKNFFIKKKINKKEMLEILNIKNDSGFEKMRDSALIGRKELTNKLLSETELLNEDSFFHLNSLNYRVLKLIDILKNNETYKNHEESLERMKPPIFWKEKPAYLEQLKKWNLKQLNIVADKIGQTETLLKKNSQIENNIIIKDLIVFLSREASGN